ncbi:MAG: hypothetical protein GY756_18135 [bacterium]|nr:hypothetical protein [bacterium]
MDINNIKFDHIGFAVKDIHKAITWYKDVLGFDKLLPPGICEMDLMGHKGYRCIIGNKNGACLELEQRTDTGFPNNQSPLISHFSLTVGNIEAMREHLKNSNDAFVDSGGTITEKLDKRIMYFTGIDGIRIELIQNK